MSEDKLKIAKKTHKTDFGTYEDLSVRRADTKIETPLGTYICYHDGTFSDMRNRLMWIQAPWGMNYNGKKFKGERIKLTWREAKKLFGYGGKISHTGSALRKEDIEKYPHNEYKRGICEVRFSGYRDWRLPTAEELLTLGLFVEKESWEKDTNYDGYDSPSAPKSKQLRETLFPDCPDIYFQGVWSANDNGEYAWGSDGQDSMGDFNVDSMRAVLFVRCF